MQRRILSIVIICLVLAFYAFLNSGFFLVEHLAWSGTKYLEINELLSYTTFYPQNVFRVNRQLLSTEIAEHPWVRQVGVSWRWPNRLIINVTERKPLAIIPVEESWFLLDQDGVLLPPPLGTQVTALPLITNIEIGNLEKLRTIARIINNIPDNLGELISEWNAEEQMLITRQGTQVFLGDLRDLDQKFTRLELIFDDLTRRGIIAKRIDLRILNSPVIVEER